MPIQSCTINGKKGYKWGSEGKCYLSKADAEKQGRAIEAGKHGTSNKSSKKKK